MARNTYSAGETATFRYSLAPDSTSEISARLAHRTGQAVTVLGIDWCDAGRGSTFEDRMDAATPVVYSVRFEDGHEDTAFEDELSD